MISRSKTISRKKPKKKAAKPKRKPIPKSIREKCLSALQRARRIEEADDRGYVHCISCGKPMHWKEAQGGHYIPRTCRATELEPDNIWPQCPQCNGARAGNPIPYRYNLAKRIGEERVRRIEMMRAANYGDQEAFEALAPKDQKEVVVKRGKIFYAERYKELKERLDKAEEGL